MSTAQGRRRVELIPCARPSTAIASVRPTTPYLETLYAVRPGNFSVAYTPEREAMLTIRPPPELRIAANAARQQRNEPVRLTASVRCQISRVVSSNGADVSEPAAHTSAAGGPAFAATANSCSTRSEERRGG